MGRRARSGQTDHAYHPSLRQQRNRGEAACASRKARTVNAWIRPPRRILLSRTTSHRGIQETKTRDLDSRVPDTPKDPIRPWTADLYRRHGASHVRDRQLLQMDRTTTAHAIDQGGHQRFRPQRVGDSEEERLRGDKKEHNELQLRRLPRKRPGTIL